MAAINALGMKSKVVGARPAPAGMAVRPVGLPISFHRTSARADMAAPAPSLSQRRLQRLK
jgi:hypothetical protein